jgi:hypothetical protein
LQLLYLSLFQLLFYLFFTLKQLLFKTTNQF